MSDTETAAPAEAAVATSERKWIATLEHGNVYVYDGQFFYKGQPVPVSDAVKSALEEDATYPVNVADGNDVSVEMRDKFVFVEVAAKETSTAARTRTRA